MNMITHVEIELTGVSAAVGFCECDSLEEVSSDMSSCGTPRLVLDNDLKVTCRVNGVILKAFKKGFVARQIKCDGWICSWYHLARNTGLYTVEFEHGRASVSFDVDGQFDYRKLVVRCHKNVKIGLTKRPDEYGVGILDVLEYDGKRYKPDYEENCHCEERLLYTIHDESYACYDEDGHYESFIDWRSFPESWELQLIADAREWPTWTDQKWNEQRWIAERLIDYPDMDTMFKIFTGCTKSQVRAFLMAAFERERSWMDIAAFCGYDSLMKEYVLTHPEVAKEAEVRELINEQVHGCFCVSRNIRSEVGTGEDYRPGEYDIDWLVVMVLLYPEKDVELNQLQDEELAGWSLCKLLSKRPDLAKMFDMKRCFNPYDPMWHWYSSMRVYSRAVSRLIKAQPAFATYRHN